MVSSAIFKVRPNRKGDGALLVDGSLLAMLEADAFSSSGEEAKGEGEGSKLSVGDLAHLTVPQLKLELRARQLSATGTKPSLLRRLLEACVRKVKIPHSANAVA